MHIREVYIFGFGKWQNKHFTFSSSNFVEITGHNESGKSTLRQFILYVLFGQTPKQLQNYLPKKGAEIGGRVMVSGLADDVVTIERIEKRNKGKAMVYFVNGDIADEQWLNDQFKRITRDDFEAIYTFDSLDLQKIQQLDRKALNDVLLSVGMTGSDRIYQAEKELEKRTGDLFKPFGKKPEINQLFEEMKYLKQQLSASKQEEATYHQRWKNVQNLEIDIYQTEEHVEQLQTQVQHIEKKLSNYRLLEEYYLICQHIKRLDSRETFPTNGLERYQQLKELLLPLKSEANLLNKNKKEIESEIREKRQHLLSETTYQHLYEAKMLLEEIEEKENECRDWKQKRQSLQNDIEHKLDVMQIPLEWQSLQHSSFPFHLEELWSDLAKQKEQLDIEKQYVQHDLAALKEKQDYLQKEKAEWEQEQIDPLQLNQYKDDLDKWVSRTNAQQQEQRYHQWKCNQKELSRYSDWTLWIGIALSIITWFSLSFMSISIVLFILSWLQRIAIHTYQSQTEKWLKPSEHMNYSLSEEDIEKRRNVIEKQHHIQRQIEMITEEWKKSSIEQLKLEERATFMKQRGQQLEQKIQDQVEQFPFLAQIDLPYWSKLYQQLTSLKEKVHKLRKIDHDISDYQSSINKKQELCFRMLGDQVDANLNSINEKLSQERQRKLSIMHLEERLQTINDQLNDCLDKQKPYLDEIGTIFDLAQVNEEEAFLEKGERIDKVQSLNQKAWQLRDSLLIWMELQEIEKVKNGDYENEITLKQKMERLQKDIKRKNAYLQSLRQQLSDEKSALSMLENKEDVSKWKHQYAIKQEALQQLAKKWAVDQVARKKLEQAKQEFYQTTMPKVIDQASIFFSKLTSNQYVRLIPLKEENWLEVEDYTGLRYTIEELSQGTKDQLYIALRLAVSQVIAGPMSLPFIIDDGFVHFDSVRKKEMFDLLEELSNKHQILYFSTVRTNSESLHLSS
ncbi:AAA family ATPase [Gracilibacillus sp. YIM 98692]|uniref:ATP-binding protein n=1 Tax=Gracilibacillus sp. YIM 98692 TaxID=2663532 RepID=UPI0013D3F8B7|nr:AAA family ATPase [Gracilibacillus sp. YIM 98692]